MDNQKKERKKADSRPRSKFQERTIVADSFVPIDDEQISFILRKHPHDHSLKELDRNYLRTEGSLKVKSDVQYVCCADILASSQ